MSHKQTDKQYDAHLPEWRFFREEAIDQLGLTPDQQAQVQELNFAPSENLPMLPSAIPATEPERKIYWRALRNFFRNGKKETPKGGAGPAPSPYPVLLAPYRSAALRSGPYPLWFADARTPEGNVRFLPAMELVRRGISAFAPQEGAAKILKDNLPRLERLLVQKVSFANEIYEAFPVLEESLAELVAELNVAGQEGQSLEEDIRRLKGVLPKTGVLVPASTQAPLHLLAAFLETDRKKEKVILQAEIDQLINRVQDILTVEKEKSPEAQSSGHLHDTLDFANGFLDFDELSSVLPPSSSDAMPEERRLRLEKILATLHDANDILFDNQASVLVAPAVDVSALTPRFSNVDVRQASADQLCRQAMDLFDEHVAACARVYVAIRLARLELGGHYRSELHADFFSHFDWRSFSAEEWSACPPVFFLVNETALLADELSDLSQLLASNRPIRIFVLKRTIHPEKRKSGKPLSDDLMIRQELGALAIAHRNVCVVQTAIVDPVFLLEGLSEGLTASSPVLFNVFAPNTATESLYLYAGAAVEGRGFPSLLYNSGRGSRWGSRFEIGNNPHAELDWPEHELTVRDESGKQASWRLPFTFADFAAQDEFFANFFQVVPPEYWQEELIPLVEFLALPSDKQFDKVPFIWVLDDQGQLQKAAVAWPLVLSCRERLDFWHFLQENAGVHSYHVEIATGQLRREIEEKFTREKEALHNAHQKDLEKTAEEAARVAMERLAATLLDMDLDADLTATARPPAPKIEAIAKVEKAPPAIQSAPAKPEAPVEEPPKEAESTDLGEAWIDTPLCTSCNECINLNKKIFQYDANKQAYVADPKGGPFADIVKAAENCPVRIIHPGSPQDPKEPGLPELIKRAAPFN